jgi:hypothetical protein
VDAKGEARAGPGASEAPAAPVERT